MAASTTINIANNTEYTASFATNHNYAGQINGTFPGTIDKSLKIEFVFVSAESVAPAVSSGAVVYQCENKKGDKFDWMYAWYYEKGTSNETYKAYTQIEKANYAWDWEKVKQKLKESGTSCKAEYDENCVSNAEISKPLAVKYQGTISLK